MKYFRKKKKEEPYQELWDTLRELVKTLKEYNKTVGKMIGK